MDKLNISREEAIQVIKDDEAIDSGKDLFPLTKEQTKVARSMRQVVPVNSKSGKKGSANDVELDAKKKIFQQIADFLADNGCDDVKMMDNQREMFFYVGKEKMKLTISVPRS